jgi:acetyl esterase/lipase
MRTVLGLISVMTLIALALVVQRSPIRVFNALTPKDWSSSRVAEGIAYGPGERRSLDIYRPSDMADGTRLPVVIFVYGGWWSSGTRSGYGFVGRALASRGFVVVIPDYRLAPSVTYPAFVEDIAGSVRWTGSHIQRFGGDPSRIVLSGHSAGAHITALLATDPHWLGSLRNSIKGFVGLAGPYDFYPFEAELTRTVFEHWRRPAETQPIHWAGAGDPPALLLTGADDDTVRPRNSAVLAARFRAGGVNAQVKAYPGIGHIGVLTAMAIPFRGRAPVLADFATFVRRVTKRDASPSTHPPVAAPHNIGG